MCASMAHLRIFILHHTNVHIIIIIIIIMADIHSAMAAIRRGKRRKKTNKRQDENIIVFPVPYGDHKYMIYS